MPTSRRLFSFVAPPFAVLFGRTLLLHGTIHPVAPSRPVARSKKNKTFQKEIPLAPCPASSKSLLAKAAATTTLKAPHLVLKRRPSKKLPPAAPLHQTAGHNGQIGTPMLWDNADAPRRVSCNKEVGAAQQEAQHEDQQFQYFKHSTNRNDDYHQSTRWISCLRLQFGTMPQRPRLPNCLLL